MKLSPYFLLSVLQLQLIFRVTSISNVLFFKMCVCTYKPIIQLTYSIYPRSNEFFCLLFFISNYGARNQVSCGELVGDSPALSSPSSGYQILSKWSEHKYDTKEEKGPADMSDRETYTNQKDFIKFLGNLDLLVYYSKQITFLPFYLHSFICLLRFLMWPSYGEKTLAFYFVFYMKLMGRGKELRLCKSNLPRC